MQAAPLIPLLALALALTAAPAAAQQPEDEPQAFEQQQALQPTAEAPQGFSEEEREQLSYGLGYDVGQSVRATLERMQADTDELSLREMAEGIRAGIAGEVPRYLQSQMGPLMERWIEQQRALVEASEAQRSQEAERQWNEAATRNLEAAREFLDQNKGKRGVRTTDSGLQYQISRRGKGDRPGEDDWVRVHYRGTTLDGNEFDSSYARQEPAVFPLDGVIPGWAEGLQLLRQGAQARFFIPPHLAYGPGSPEGGPLPFGPNSLLIFEVELLEFADSQEALLGPEAQPGG